MKLFIVDPMEYRAYNRNGQVTAVRHWEQKAPFKNYKYEIDVPEDRIIWEQGNVLYVQGVQSEEYIKECEQCKYNVSHK